MENNGSAFHSCVELRCHCISAVAENAGKLLEREEFVVPREFVCTRNRCTGKVIMELMPDEADDLRTAD